MFILIDNYDSFTYNLWHYFGEMGAEVEVHRNDALTVEEVLARKPQGIILSPGPCDPDRAGICLPLIAAACKAPTGPIPLFGVCLGHQSIGQAFGGQVVRAPQPLHGKVSTLTHTSKSVFAGIDSPFQATRYHSLIVDRPSLPDCLEVTCESDDGLIMGLAHRDLPVHGVQFHPESIASEHGHAMIKNFVDLAVSGPNTPQLGDAAA